VTENKADENKGKGTGHRYEHYSFPLKVAMI